MYRYFSLIVFIIGKTPFASKCIIFCLFKMTINAIDYGTPRLQTQNPITVTIFVIRNQFSPVFQNLPYQRSMQQTVQSGSSVFQVTATDADTRVCLKRHILHFLFCFCYSSLLMHRMNGRLYLDFLDFLLQTPYNQVTYSIVSQGNNVNLFSIQQDGVIRITNTVTSSSDAQYTVSDSLSLSLSTVRFASIELQKYEYIVFQLPPYLVDSGYGS